jgi:hypothetical protein
MLTRLRADVERLRADVERLRGTPTPTGLDADHDWALWFEKWTAAIDLMGNQAARADKAEAALREGLMNAESAHAASCPGNPCHCWVSRARAALRDTAPREGSPELRRVMGLGIPPDEQPVAGEGCPR